MSEDFPDLPLHEDDTQSSGIAFSVNLQPHTRPREASRGRRIAASLFDACLLAVAALGLLALLRLLLPLAPLGPQVAAALIETILLGSILFFLTAFFWGSTPGYRLLGLTVVDREREPPDAKTTLLWFSHHLASCLTLGIFGAIFQIYVIDKPFYVVDRSSLSEVE